MEKTESLVPPLLSLTPTYNSEHVLLDVSPDVDAAAALGVVRPAQAGDVHHAALVHVHHAGCRVDRKKGTVSAGVISATAHRV